MREEGRDEEGGLGHAPRIECCDSDFWRGWAMRRGVLATP
jgi:hypothetical protein